MCCANRKAEMINKYYPMLKNWEEPYFLTLTVKSCKADQLKGYINSMLLKPFKRLLKSTENAIKGGRT